MHHEALTNGSLGGVIWLELTEGLTDLTHPRGLQEPATRRPKQRIELICAVGFAVGCDP